MSIKKLPKLLSLRQYAALIGRNATQVRYLIKRGRIPKSQRVDGRYVIAEDASILRSGLPTDETLLRGIPAHLVSEEILERSWDNVPEFNTNQKSNVTQKKVIAWNYAKYVEGLTQQEIYATTGVHFFTQKKLREQEPVRGSVVVRLARNLGVDVEDLLRRGE